VTFDIVLELDALRWAGSLYVPADQCAAEFRRIADVLDGTTAPTDVGDTLRLLAGLFEDLR